MENSPSNENLFSQTMNIYSRTKNQSITPTTGVGYGNED
jgi:hypothetical protein